MRLRHEARWKDEEKESRDSWSADSPIEAQWRCVKHQGGRQSQLFCSWATHVNRKWTYSLLICLVASKFVLLRVFSLIETICPKICSKSSLKSAESQLPDDARPSKWSLLFRHQQSLVQKNGKYCAMHHPRRTLGSCWSPQIPWSWAIQWSKLLGLWQKANRSLGVIRRNLIKCPENVKEQAYLTLVRPQLEYVDVAHGIRTFESR